jgi:long-subunit acyl-CoA synthetase (AMP-forming)
VGRVLSSCKVALRDWEEGNYRNSDAENPAVRMPRGEILVGGPCVALGYYNNPDAPDPEITEKNATDFITAPDGTRYFCTGDIGQFTASGMLQIIDRKKDLVKLQMGEYVALSKVENAMKQSNLVENALCYAESTKSNVVALVVPAVPTLRAWAKTAGRPDDEDWAALCKAPEAAKAVLASVQAACKGKLVAFEVPVAVALVDDPWTPENDCVTAAMKLKRQVITKKHKDLLTAIYK